MSQPIGGIVVVGCRLLALPTLLSLTMVKDSVGVGYLVGATALNGFLIYRVTRNYLFHKRARNARPDEETVREDGREPRTTSAD